ncbi:TonB family protein [Thermocrinis albus DSM 14484]|uniref:TonB family protein n=1 Tax=Thermocrinis albus (strain DSM 14484 / JCM 11386 / HI 11/12) TaxID=638303 RepID=D3SNS0_THEAH|nr:energy transducer TonB [Thermocrinis albus]ADC88807.1 TonB family protein [Thermocrinis albus DSM 14484]
MISRGALLLSAVAHALVLVHLHLTPPLPQTAPEGRVLLVNLTDLQQVSAPAKAFPKSAHKERRSSVRSLTPSSVKSDHQTPSAQKEFQVSQGNQTPAAAVTEKEASKSESVAEEPPKRVFSPEEAGEEYLKNYGQLVRDAVARYLSYPPLAKRMGWEGKVILRIVLDKEGKLLDLTIQKSSGYQLLDQAALEAVERAHSFFPKPGIKVVILLPVAFRLE